MLSETLQKEIIGYLKKKNKFNFEISEEFVKKIATYSKNAIINPYKIIDDLELDEKIAKNLFFELVSLEVLELVYKVYCKECNKMSTNTYSDIEEITKEFYCEKCKNDIDIENKKNIRVFFRVEAE